MYMELGVVTAEPRPLRKGRGYFNFAHMTVAGRPPQDVYFNSMGGRRIICSGESIVFGDFFTEHDRVLLPGDTIRFRLGQNDKGMTAYPWGLAREYDEASRKLGLSPATLYRVLTSVFEHGHIVVRDEVACEPMTLVALQGAHPKAYQADKDPFPQRMVYGDFVHKFRFERQLPDGTWRTCADPRPEPVRA